MKSSKRARKEANLLKNDQSDQSAIKSNEKEINKVVEEMLNESTNLIVDRIKEKMGKVKKN